MDISFISLGLGLMTGAVVWLYGWAAQLPMLSGGTAFAGSPMTSQRGLTSMVLTFILFTIIYLTMKYENVISQGNMTARVVCVAVMLVIVFLMMSLLRGAGIMSSVSSMSDGLWKASLPGMLSGGVAMLAGAIVCVMADRALPTSRVKGILLYAVAIVALVIAAACIALMVMGNPLGW